MKIEKTETASVEEILHNLKQIILCHASSSFKEVAIQQIFKKNFNSDDDEILGDVVGE